MARLHPSLRPPLAFAVLGLTGCSSIIPFPARPAPSHADARVTVENPRFEDLTVYLERDGSRMRLGVVPGNTTRTLTIPDPLVVPNATHRLLATSTGRDVRGVSTYFDLEPGCRAWWIVGISGLSTPVSLVPPDTEPGRT